MDLEAESPSSRVACRSYDGVAGVRLANARGFLDQGLVAYIADDTPMMIGGKFADDIMAATANSDAYSKAVLPNATLQRLHPRALSR